jgi:threonylcarbamoyladenosine tRNA methylthiotransferase MtaB
MKIEDGCDRFCTYCIIPTARGWVRSKPVAEIKDEAENLAKNGYVEVVLVGINLTSYGKGEDINICDAVDAVCSVSGIKRVRLGSLEPDHITDQMLERFKKQEKFCPQFHLSLQSGCDKT